MKKTKKYFIYSTIIILFTALFYSCKNDIENVVASITGSPDDEVAAAQEWYNKTQQDTLAIGIARVKSSKTKFSAKPDWKHAYSIKNDGYSAVHTPLSTKERFSFVTAENKQAYEATGDERYISIFTQMVVINEKKDNKTYAFLMTLVPDKAYLESTHFAAFSSNYRKWQKGYSGYVFYHTLDGKFNNGWKFENGKITMSATQVDENGVDISMGAKRKVSSGTICTTLTYEIWTARCQYTYTISETQGIQNLTIGTCGSYDYQGNQYLVTCYDDGNSVGNNTGEYTSSGSNPTTTSTPTECVGDKCPICGGIVSWDFSEGTTPSNVKSTSPACPGCTCKRDYPASKECLAYKEMYNNAIASNNEYLALITTKGIHSWKTEEVKEGVWSGPYNPHWDSYQGHWYLGTGNNKEYIIGVIHVHWDPVDQNFSGPEPFTNERGDVGVAETLKGCPLFLLNAQGQVKYCWSNSVNSFGQELLPYNVSSLFRCEHSIINFCLGK